MRILFDQGTPVPLRRYLADHSVDTAFERGWFNLQNSELIAASEKDGYQLLISTDQSLRYQQNLSDRQLAIIVLLSASWPRIQPRVDDIRTAVDKIVPGDYKEVSI